MNRENMGDEALVRYYSHQPLTYTLWACLKKAIALQSRGWVQA